MGIEGRRTFHRRLRNLFLFIFFVTEMPVFLTLVRIEAIAVLLVFVGKYVENSCLTPINPDYRPPLLLLLNSLSGIPNKIKLKN